MILSAGPGNEALAETLAETVRSCEATGGVLIVLGTPKGAGFLVNATEKQVAALPEELEKISRKVRATIESAAPFSAKLKRWVAMMIKGAFYVYLFALVINAISKWIHLITPMRFESWVVIGVFFLCAFAYAWACLYLESHGYPWDEKITNIERAGETPTQGPAVHT